MQELERKLRERGYSEQAVSPVIADLTDRGLLSEARMAEVYVSERLRKGFGPLKVRQELRRKGVPDALIDPHLCKSSQEWLELMRVVDEKKFGSQRSADPGELARRARFMEYRGFPADLIRRLLNTDDPC